MPYQDQSNIARWRGAAGGVRCRGNTWFIPYETIQHRDRDRPHPATFPTRLPEQCLRLHGLDRIQVAMDPFTGLGSTAVACARLGVNFIGADLDEAYLDAAIERVWETDGEASAARDGGAGKAGCGRMAKGLAYFFVDETGFGGGLSTYSLRNHGFAPFRAIFTSTWRRRLVASGFFE